MFGPKHYVPILKWKKAEQKALQELSANQKEWITPLIQPVMPQPKAPKKGQRAKNREEQLEEVITDFKAKSPKIAGEIVNAWGTLPIFLDLSLIYTPKLIIEALAQILATGSKLGTFLIPVVNLSSDKNTLQQVSTLARQYDHGLCLRLVRADLIDVKTLSFHIEDLLADNNLSPAGIDLLVDFNAIDEQDQEYHDLFEEIKNIPYLTQWRTFTVACGAFPEDLSSCTPGIDKYIPRLEWKQWLYALSSDRFPRKPTFADYTIRHPIYKESNQFFQSSSSLKYTLDESWLIMRGKKGNLTQYLGHANLLSRDPHYSSMFRGAAFSFGDAFIAKKGQDLHDPKPGNSTSWILVGINHHLANTVDQIANLS